MCNPTSWDCRGERFARCPLTYGPPAPLIGRELCASGVLDSAVGVQVGRGCWSQRDLLLHSGK